MLSAARNLLRLSWQQSHRKMIVAVMLMAGNAVALPASGLALKWLTNSALAGHPGSAALAGVAVAVAALAGLTCSHFAHIAYFEVSELNVLTMDERLIALSNGSPYLTHHEHPEQADRMTIVQQEMQRVGEALQAVLSGGSLAVSMLITAVLLAYVHPALLLLPVLAVPTLWASRRAQQGVERTRDASATDTRRAQYYFRLASGARAANELRLFRLTPQLLRGHAGSWDRASRTLWYGEVAGACWRAAGQAVFAISYVAGLVLVIRDATRGRTTVGDVVLAITLAAQINQQVASASTLLGQLQRNAQAFHRYEQMEAFVHTASAPVHSTSAPVLSTSAPVLPDQAALDRPAPDGPAPHRLAPDRLAPDRLAPDRLTPDRLVDGIRLEAVAFQYAGTDAPVLRDVNLHLPAGSTVAIVGENGAGKTTLVKLLCRLYPPTEGRIVIDGADLASLDLADWRSRLSAGFQDFVRFELTAREAVGVGDLARVDSDDAIREALGRAHSTVLADLPYGLATRLGKAHVDRGVELSGGQWQQLALGRAMMRREPLLLVLDEPTSALDAEAEHRLFTQFRAGAERVTRVSGGITVFVSHRFSTVRMADLIIVVAGGQIREFGDHDTLIGNGGLYAELYGLQAAAYR